MEKKKYPESLRRRPKVRMLRELYERLRVIAVALGITTDELIEKMLDNEEGEK